MYAGYYRPHMELHLVILLHYIIQNQWTYVIWLNGTDTASPAALSSIGLLFGYMPAVREEGMISHCYSVLAIVMLAEWHSPNTPVMKSSMFHLTLPKTPMADCSCLPLEEASRGKVGKRATKL